MENNLSWVTFQECLKLLFSTQTKQDVVVGQRVIHLKKREDDEIKYQALLANSQSGIR